MNNHHFKKIQVVPSAGDFIDIILSKTQRKTPTVIHKGYHIARIRNFYMRKVKFAQDAFEEKLNQILMDFPKLEDVHPFYADLMNVLYDKDHYKIALGQLNTARHLIDHVAKEYIKLLKFGDSLYRCKCLKKAALGRMATIMKKQKDGLAYLEQVRQHLARLPSIDPSTRTLLICGYPNVGKSSFMNKVTRAEVDVQPYAFTTKSLFVGHLDYKYLRWQVIDTPGILDHPLEDRNTIEMQSITALAHIRSCILYFIDFSEKCGYSIADQVKLFMNIKPLFVNKPVLLVANKSDLRRFENLDESEKALVQGILEQGVELVESSSMTDEGVMNVRNTACEKLLAQRVEYKLKGNKVSDVLNKLHLSVPKPRDEKAREPYIPDAVKQRVKYDKQDPMRRRLERDLEEEAGGAGVYNIDLKKHYLTAEPDWKYDIIPEIMDGKNIADFIDPEIEAKLDQLEREEEEKIARGEYVSSEEDSEDERIEELAKEVQKKREFAVLSGRLKQTKNRPGVSLVDKALNKKGRTLLKLKAQILQGKVANKLRMHVDAEGEEGNASSLMEVDGSKDERALSRARSVSRMRALSERAPSRIRERSMTGLSSEKEKIKSQQLRHAVQKRPKFIGKQGEADRHIHVTKPKHLFAGKRTGGTHDRR